MSRFLSMQPLVEIVTLEKRLFFKRGFQVLKIYETAVESAEPQSKNPKLVKIS